MSLLAEGALRKLEEAAIAAGLASTERRPLLLRHLPAQFLEALPQLSRPGDQLRSDLYELNSIPELLGVEKPPLVIWLENAIDLTRSLPMQKVLMQIKEALSPSSSDSINFARAFGDFKDLRSRRELVQTSISLLTRPSRSYRASIVGPLFLHPSWYMDRRNKRVSLPNYDNVLASYIKQISIGRTNTIRLILTNSDRYKAKIESYIEPSERRIFQDYVLQAIDTVWGINSDQGPDICCVHPGFLHIQMIFDSAVIVTYRPSQMIPTTGGVLSYSSEVVERERAVFDNVFDSCSDGQQTELKKLKNYISGLW